MRIKVNRGSSPSQLFDYLLDPAKQTEERKAALHLAESVRGVLICSTVPGETASQLALNFRRIAKLNSNVQRIVAHYSVSLPEEDNERVGSAEMRQISRFLLEQFGHGRSPYFAVEHHDTAHHHWHLAASTVNYDGSWVDDSFERYRAREVERAIEKAFGLKQSQMRPATEIKNLSTGEHRLKKRTRKLLPKERLWAAIDSCLTKAASLERFLLEMRINHPEVSIRFKNKSGKLAGISFGIEGLAFSGGKLGRAYSLNGLKLYHGINFNDGSKAFIDSISSLSLTECQELYLAVETDSLKNKLTEFRPTSASKRAVKPQLEA